MRIRVHIERLVLKGLRARDPQALASGIEGELARQLSVPGAAERFTRQEAAAHFARDVVRVERHASTQVMAIRAVRGIVSGDR